MQRAAVLLLPLTAFAALAGCADHREPLQGTWVPADAPAGALPSTVIVFSDERLMIRKGDQTFAGEWEVSDASDGWLAVKGRDTERRYIVEFRIRPDGNTATIRIDDREGRFRRLPASDASPETDNAAR